MPTPYAVLLTLGLLVGLGGPILYFIFHSGDSAEPDPSQWGPIQPMSVADIEKIESALQVKLPRDFVEFLMAGRTQDLIDDQTVLPDARSIIRSTLLYRKGAYGLAPWPATWIYVGDEADACPYVLGCESGRFFQTHKGNLHAEPISSHTSFSAFVEGCKADAEHDLGIAEERATKPQKWHEYLTDFIPVMVGLLVFFVGLPLVAFCISQIYNWLFGK